MEHRTDTTQAPLSVYFCGKEDCAPGHFFGPAVRPHYLLHVILDGKGFYEKDGITYHLEQGDAFLIPPMESAYYQADRGNPWSYAWVGFDGKNCPDILKQTVFSDSFVWKTTGSENTLQLTTWMQSLLNAFQTSRGGRLQPLGQLLLLLSCMQIPDTPGSQDSSHQYFQKAKEYIDNNYTYDIRISDIAHHVGIDRTYLYRIFMEQENISPKQYLMQHRIRMAAQLLCSTTYTITEVAFSCGFKDSPSFCKFFKKYINTTPKIFRQRFQIP